MKRVIAITAAFVVACSAIASAQSQPPSLVDVAKKEEERRKSVKKPAKVYTNSSLATPDPVTSEPPSAASTATPGGNASPTTTPDAAAEQAEPGDTKDQAYWASRMSKARDDLRRLQMFGDALQTRINALRTDFVNRDNRVEREQIEKDLNAALAELERVKKDIAAGQKAIAAIEDEARRANVPSGWLRSPE
jgi:hypothetical protein